MKYNVIYDRNSFTNKYPVNYECDGKWKFYRFIPAENEKDAELKTKEYSKKIGIKLKLDEVKPIERKERIIKPKNYVQGFNMNMGDDKWMIK